jgi:putative acetyltransferase
MQFQNYFLRPASNGDVAQIKAVIFSVLIEYGSLPDENGKDKDLNNIEKSYFAKNGFFAIAVDSDSNDIVGTCGLFPISGQTCELRKMYLLKKVRGKGLGKFILSYCIKTAKEKRYQEIVLETISPLKEAISLYKQFGFSEIKPKEINDRVDQAFRLELLGE